MTVGERQRLVAHLEMTEGWLQDEVTSLSPAQYTFKMTPESWSVEEVVMHLAIAEPQYWDQFKQSLAKPAQPDFKPQSTDAGMLWYGIDRTQRTTTGEARVPRGQFKDIATAHASFKKLRAEMMKTAKETQDDLRGRQFLTASTGSVSVVPDDLDALAAAHPADPGSKGAQELSEEISDQARRSGITETKGRGCPGPLPSQPLTNVTVLDAQPDVVPQLLHL